MVLLECQVHFRKNNVFFATIDFLSRPYNKKTNNETYRCFPLN